MPLPTLFANLTNPTGPELDTNFSVVGLLGVLPCTVAGTNTLLLTGAATNPTVSAYANYLQFSAIAANTNTGAVTAQYGLLGALNVYKDGPSGPSTLTGNEIIANDFFELVYDSTLNSSAGGFHLRSSGSSTGTNISPANINCSGIATIGTLDVTGSVTGILSVSSISFNGGAPVTRLITASQTVTFTVLVANASQDATATVAGVQLGDAVIVTPPAGAAAGLVLQGRVLAAGSIGVRALNVTGASITAPTGVYRIVDIGFT